MTGLRVKTNVSKAGVGDGRVYSIRRGRKFELLGALTSKEKRLRNGRFIGWDVVFEDAGGVTYRGFAGPGTVISYRQNVPYQPVYSKFWGAL